MNQQVIFFQVGIGEKAFEECRIFAQSLREVGKCKERIIVVTDQERLPCDKHLGIETIYTWTVTKYASPQKFMCFNLLRPDMLKDGWIFFFDSDFVTVAPVDLDAILAACKPDKVNVYGYQDQGRTQNHRCMAGGITKRKAIIRQPAFCAGMFLLQVSNVAAEASFKKVHDSYMALVKGVERKPGDKHDPGHGQEQPRFCYHLLGDNLANISLTPFVDEYRNLGRLRKRRKRTAVFMHFCGGTSRGFGRNTEGRLRAMRRTLRLAKQQPARG